MAIIAGVDIGNSTTEICLARVEQAGIKEYLASSIIKTTGIKGTLANVPGIIIALQQAVKASGLDLASLAEIRLNEATPVIGDLAMETITETIITESTMIGHNPSTPGGIGLGVGMTIAYHQLAGASPGDKVICLVPGGLDFEEVAHG
ncbi:MAG: diol dehydratase reactivase subunit alpha, partial [Sporomusa sp.]